MISRGNDFFSKSNINNPRKWWQRSKRQFKKYEDKSYPCEDHENPQEINDNILYPYWKKVPENNVFNNDQEDIDFKDREENIIERSIYNWLWRIARSRWIFFGNCNQR